MSTPASSCSFSTSKVASRLARVSSSPFDFQGAQSVLGSASHSGFGKEPAIVVGNSMRGLPGFWLSVSLPCLMVEVQNNESRPRRAMVAAWICRGNHDRPALRADAERLENIDHAGGTGPSLYRHSRQH